MKDDKRKKLEANTKNLLELLGEDPSREGLLNTPKSCLLYTSDAADD